MQFKPRGSPLQGGLFLWLLGRGGFGMLRVYGLVYLSVKERLWHFGHPLIFVRIMHGV